MPLIRETMTSRDSYLEAQQQLSQIKHALANPHLSSERRRELQDHELVLTSTLARPLWPLAWPRRWLMILIFTLGIQQALVGHYEGLLWWLLLPLFSPRLSAEIASRLAVGSDQ